MRYNLTPFETLLDSKLCMMYERALHALYISVQITQTFPYMIQSELKRAIEETHEIQN